MAQQQGGGGGGGDHSMTPMIFVGLLFAVAFVIWRMAKAYIVAFVFKANIFQAQLVSFFVKSPTLDNDIMLMQTLNPATVSWDQMVQLTYNVGLYMRYPISVIMVFLAIYLYQSNITLKFRKPHSMKSLRAQEQHNWPAIMPIVKEDLVSQDVNQGPWAMALTPLEFAQKYNLLKKDDVLLNVAAPGMEFTAGVRKGDAKRVFTLQLGPYWEGFDHCPPHAIAIVAVCLARINRDRASATLILETLDKTYAEGKPDYSIAKPILKKYQDIEEVREIIAKHAYLLTVLASLLEAARQDGVVPSAEFLWLKTVDRRLWYMLNSIGRQTPFSEAAGPFAHWKAEKALGRRSLMPMIDEAIKALEVAIKEIKLTPKVFRELKP